MTSAAATASALFPPIVFEPAPATAGAGVTIADPGPATVLAVSRADRPRPIHHLYRGTRGLAFVFLGVAGLGVMGLGALTNQVVAAYGDALPAANASLFATLQKVAPFVMVAGFAQLLATWAVVRDKRNAMRTGLVVSIGGAIVAGTFAAIVALGGASSSVAAAAAGTDLAGMLVWIAALDVLAALSIRRVVRGRATS